MIGITRSIAIRAPAERVFAHLSEPGNLLEIWPSLVAVRNATVGDDGRHAFDWTYRMAGLPFRGHCDTTAVVPGRSREDHNSGGIPSTFRWRFEPAGEGTNVELAIEYEVPGIVQIVAGAALRAMNEREADTLLANLKARMEEGGGAVRRGG
ncbi:SRPBCC family protein [Anaeromyxobacter sp. PSR-1]|uniref:SRPBCC family protein n=1 Tax=Anaeromyxobacter sp. PSR-1 TaxID=1300915 RepID=UPI0005DDB660|nr:SRPBCC family protein [Anaeromyxobacter sp. PSR-1]GAO02882.1 polyketide cyclase / dehydrase and lipid transport [Anaeromyxobacter sp. PSR-1]